MWTHVHAPARMNMHTPLHTYTPAHTLPTHSWCSASPPSKASGYQGHSNDTALHPAFEGGNQPMTQEFSKSMAVYPKYWNPSCCTHDLQGTTCQTHRSTWGGTYRDIYSLCVGYGPLIQNAWHQKWYSFLIVSELGIFAETYLSLWPKFKWKGHASYRTHMK